MQTVDESLQIVSGAIRLASDAAVHARVEHGAWLRLADLLASDEARHVRLRHPADVLSVCRRWVLRGCASIIARDEPNAAMMFRGFGGDHESGFHLLRGFRDRWRFAPYSEPDARARARQRADGLDAVLTCIAVDEGGNREREWSNASRYLPSVISAAAASNARETTDELVCLVGQLMNAVYAARGCALCQLDTFLEEPHRERWGLLTRIADEVTWYTGQRDEVLATIPDAFFDRVMGQVRNISPR
jgi:hypothetical protein